MMDSYGQNQGYLDVLYPKVTLCQIELLNDYTTACRRFQLTIDVHDTTAASRKPAILGSAADKLRPGPNES